MQWIVKIALTRGTVSTVTCVTLHMSLLKLLTVITASMMVAKSSHGISVV